jgi:hypothetical protein
MKKKLAIGIGITVLIIMILAVIFVINLMPKSNQPATNSESSDGLAQMFARFYDQNGNLITSSVRQAIIQGSYQQVTYMAFDLKASNPGSINVYNVKPINPAGDMGSLFANSGSSISVNLSTGQNNIAIRSSDQSCTTDTNCDTNEKCIGSPLTCKIKVDNYTNAPQPKSFTISLGGDTYDALGVLMANSVISTPVTLSYNFLTETCSDGTPINTCNTLNKPKYCSFTPGSAPILIDNSTGCGCPTNMHINGGGCTWDTCADGTIVNNCSVGTTGASGAYYFCKPGMVYEQRCNQCGARLDYYGNSKISCSPTSGEPSLAVYQTYTGSLTAGLTAR